MMFLKINEVDLTQYNIFISLDQNNHHMERFGKGVLNSVNMSPKSTSGKAFIFHASNSDSILYHLHVNHSAQYGESQI